MSKISQRYVVRGWLNGSDYDAGKPASCELFVFHYSTAQAEDLGETRIANLIGKCDVIIANLCE